MSGEFEPDPWNCIVRAISRAVIFSQNQFFGNDPKSLLKNFHISEMHEMCKIQFLSPLDLEYLNYGLSRRTSVCFVPLPAALRIIEETGILCG